MEILTANQAKTNFGEVLIKAQHSPIHINKNGKPIVVMISSAEFEKIEELKIEMLKIRAKEAKQAIKLNKTSDGVSFINKLVSEIDH